MRSLPLVPQGEVGGIILYVAAFCVGEILHLPGILFVGAGVLVWGCVGSDSARIPATDHVEECEPLTRCLPLRRRLGGWLLGVITAPIAVTAPFVVVRRCAWQPSHYFRRRRLSSQHSHHRGRDAGLGGRGCLGRSDGRCSNAYWARPAELCRCTKLVLLDRTGRLGDP